MLTKNVKISIAIVASVLTLVFGLTAFFLFFDNKKQNNSVDAATVTDSYSFEHSIYPVILNISYNNNYGSISNVSGGVDVSWALNLCLGNLTIIFALNSNFAWNTNSMTITDYSGSSITFNRSGNSWVAANDFACGKFSNGSVTYNITFPIADLVEANFTSQTYNINYNLNGGSYGSSHPSTYSSSISSQTETVSRPSRTGYTFSSWSVSGAGASISGTTLTIPARGTGNITLTANWELQSFTVSVLVNDNTLGGVSSTGGTYLRHKYLANRNPKCWGNLY